jgi:hypothetical protein
VDAFVYPQFIGYAQRAPTTQDIYNPGTRWQDNSVNPAVIYETTGAGIWLTGGDNEATTTTFGIVQLATLSELQNGNAPAGAIVPLSNDVATVIQGIVVGAVPPATETQAGIAEIATQVETDAGTLDDKIVTPLKLANFVASGGFPGVFTDLTATGTVSFTGATGGIVMTSATASSFGTTGAGIDLTLDSSAGRVIINGEEAASNAITLLSAAGGLDVNTALQINVDSSQAAADAIRIIASDAAGGLDIDVGTGGATLDSTGVISVDAAGLINVTSTRANAQAILISTTQGGIDISATGTAGLDIDITATGSSVNLTSTENAAEAIYLHANGGLLETIRLHADQGTGVASVNIGSDVGGITIAGGLGTADAVNITASTAGGGIDIDSSTGGFDVLTTGAISLDASLASNLTVTGASVDLTLSSAGGSVVITGTEAAVDAVQINGNTGAGGIDVNAGTGGMTVDSGGLLSLDAAGVVNLTTTGAFDITVNSTAGSVIVTGSEAAVDAVQINATTALGGIDINAGTGGITVDSGGLMSLDAAGVVNLTTTGAFDITVNSTAGSIVIRGAEAAVDAILLDASNAAGGIDMNAGTGGMTMDTTAAISLDSATASNFTVTGAADLTLQSTAGAVNVISGEANADSINVTSAGGMNIVATGAAAKDIIITNTNGSMTLTAGENVTDAMNFTASGAASRINLTAGTGSINLASGLIVAKKDVVFADSPYVVLGTDYFLSVDTSGGAVTVTLPNAATLAGRTYVIRDTGGAAAATNITVATAGGNLVGGGASAATKVISAAYAGATVYSNGVTWNYCYVA